MSTSVFNAVKRDRAGKGASRSIRNSGLVPAVIYGGKKEPNMISLKPIEIMHELQKGYFYSRPFEVSVDGGETEKVIARAVQFHVVTDKLLNIDFQRFDSSDELKVELPVKFINEHKTNIFKLGAVLNIVKTKILVTVKPDSMPKYLELDLSEAKFGSSYKMAELSLPEGVKLPRFEGDDTIATIIGKSKE